MFILYGTSTLTNSSATPDFFRFLFLSLAKDLRTDTASEETNSDLDWVSDRSMRIREERGDKD
uniref:Uncharacterized protein n=1 Tax=Oryza punctata TaxID=4537 RepID=A0A0E0M869_ORYPU